MLTVMVPYRGAGIGLNVLLAIAVLCIHPNFELKDGVLHQGSDAKAQRVFVDLGRADSLASFAAALKVETSSTHIAKSANSLDLIGVRIC